MAIGSSDWGTCMCMHVCNAVHTSRAKMATKSVQKYLLRTCFTHLVISILKSCITYKTKMFPVLWHFTPRFKFKYLTNYCALLPSKLFRFGWIQNKYTSHCHFTTLLRFKFTLFTWHQIYKPIDLFFWIKIGSFSDNFGIKLDTNKHDKLKPRQTKFGHLR